MIRQTVSTLVLLLLVMPYLLVEAVWGWSPREDG